MVTQQDDILNQLSEIQKKLDNNHISKLTEMVSQAFISLGTTNKALLTKVNELEARINELRMPEVRHYVHQTRQTLNVAAKRIPIHRSRPIRCLFLVHAVETWDAQAPIYRAMCEAEDFEPIVATTHGKVARTVDFVGEDINHAGLEALGVPHIRFKDPDSYAMLDIIKAMSPDIIFRQMPWDALIPPAFSAAEINFARICYVPYGYLTAKRFQPDESPDSPSSTLHTDQYFQRVCWRIFCETEMHYSMYVNNSVRAGDNVVVTGYPKFDSLLESKNREPYWPVESKGNKKPFRIIWAPHHSVTADWLGFGTFLETHNDMYGWALKTAGEYEFVLKPHPALWGELTRIKKVMDQPYLDSFLAAWNALPNTALIESGDYGPLFCASDAMITDGLSFFSEYQIFEKPLLFMDSGRHFGFNEAGAVVMESANNVKNVTQARALCDKLKSGAPDPMREEQKRVLKRIMPYPGQTGQKIIEAIREGLEQDHGKV